jgi:hypothetical protein
MNLIPTSGGANLVSCDGGGGGAEMNDITVRPYTTSTIERTGIGVVSGNVRGGGTVNDCDAGGGGGGVSSLHCCFPGYGNSNYYINNNYNNNSCNKIINICSPSCVGMSFPSFSFPSINKNKSILPPLRFSTGVNKNIVSPVNNTRVSVTPTSLFDIGNKSGLSSLSNVNYSSNNDLNNCNNNNNNVNDNCVKLPPLVINNSPVINSKNLNRGDNKKINNQIFVKKKQNEYYNINNINNNNNNNNNNNKEKEENKVISDINEGLIKNIKIVQQMKIEDEIKMKKETTNNIIIDKGKDKNENEEDLNKGKDEEEKKREEER